MYYIGGSFAKYLKGNAVKYKDIDIYVKFENIAPLLEKLSKVLKNCIILKLIFYQKNK